MSPRAGELKKCASLANRMISFCAIVGAMPASAALMAPKSAVNTKATASAEPSDLPAAASTANTRFGIELGTFTDLNSVKNAWRKLSQDHAALFASLDPVATVRDRSGRTELLLVAGPFKSAADASEHCGKVEAAGLICQPAFYLGQPLAMR